MHRFFPRVVGASFAGLIAFNVAAQQPNRTRPPAATPAATTDTTRSRGDSSSRGGPFGGLKFRSIGPAVTSGRVSDIAVHPRDRKIWYVATASGGVWKTINAGTTWTPVFDSEGSYSIGTVVVDSA